jgi:hypothetical protein
VAEYAAEMQKFEQIRNAFRASSRLVPVASTVVSVDRLKGGELK